MKHLYITLTLVVVASLLLGAVGRPRKTSASPGPVPAPIVIQRTPERGEELPLDGAIELVFDRAMDQAAVESAFSITPQVEGRFEWADERTVRFHPTEPLARSTTYRVSLGMEAEAADGAPLKEAYRFRFTTVGYLEVSQVIPAPKSYDVETDGSITVMLNRPVVPLTTLDEQADLPQPLTFEPEVTGSGEWLNTSMYIFTPDKPLAGGTTYTARIAAGLSDTTGGLLEEDYAWTFSTEPPKVVWTTPQTDETLVAPVTKIEVQFNQPIDRRSFEEAFSLKAEDGRGVLGAFEYYTETLVFQPDEMLAFDQTYEVRIASGVTSLSGGEGMRSDYKWRFTTVPLPRIIGTSPRDGDRDTYSYTDFRITFNAPINPDTVMDNLTMTPPFSPTQVYTYFDTWENSFVLYFGAQPSTDYEVHIGPNIADPYGNTTGQEMTVRFTTAALSPMVRLHVPGQVGTYNAADPARLFVAYLNTSRLDLMLYRLDAGGFFQAQRDWYDFTPSGSDLIHAWSVSVEAPLNKEQYLPVDLVKGGGRLPPGIYLLDIDSPDVTHERWSHRHLLVVSEINLTLKVANDEMLAWATDLATGRPVEGLELKALTWDGAELGMATTDADGLAHFDTGNRQRHNIFVISAVPFAMGSEQWNPGITPWEFGFGQEYKRDFRAHVYTERPIYRAGQMVYFRGIIRAEDDAHYSLPDLGPMYVTIRDAAGEEVYNEELELDEFGAFQGELALPRGASLGHYQIQAEFAGYSFRSRFQVAAYRPPEFEVVVTPDQEEVVAGQPTGATVEVKYFFGGPVVDVPVQWNVMAATYRFKPPQFGRYSFTDTEDPWICFDCWWWRPEPPQVVLSGSGRTDKSGQLVIELPGNIAQLTVAPDREGPVGSRRLIVEATASGADNQVISGRKEIIVHQGEFYIGLASRQYIGRAEKEMSADIVTVDWAGERFPNQKLKVEVYRREWVNTFVEDEAGGGRWKWETVDTLVFEETIATDENAEAVTTFTPTEGGSYHIVVNGRDPTERLVQSSIFVWVSGREYVSWRRENNDRINLIADKGSYTVGETAEILIPSPFQGEQYALITVERGNIIHREVIQLESNSQVYELPITLDHVPNIYVSAVIVKGQDEDNPVANYKVGYAAFSVDPEPQKLTITLTPSVEKAGPGDTVTYQVRATDHTGEPVAAAFSLDLVDKAILTLSPRQPGAIVNTFYGQRGLGVNTSSGLSISINRLVLEQLKERGEEYDRGLGGGGEGMVLGETTPTPAATMMAPAMAKEAPAEEREAAPPPGVELREEFADTAYWNATVVTDQTGRASVEIPLPDNLTTWVCRGVGITTNTQVGEATSEIVVTKPLLVRPVTPRFFVVDDRAELAAIVNNNTDEALDVVVALSSTGLTLHSAEEQTVNIPAGGEAKVTWDVTVLDVENAELIFSAVSDEYGDAARPRLTTGPEGTLLVYRYSAPEVVGTGGQLVEQGTRTEVVALPPRYDERQGQLMIQLDPSLAAGMQDGLKYLEHFPYECSEQVVSRFLPNVLTYRALRDLGIERPELEEKLPDLVETGLNKLYLLQHDDGGWGWWSGGESNPHLSAYVIFGLDKAREAGFEVREEVITRGLEYLFSNLVSGRELESYRQANRQAFILYVLAEAGNAAWASEYAGDLFQNREKLSHYGRAFLAMTVGLIKPDDTRIHTLLSDLNNAAILSATGAHWEEANYDWWAMNTDTRSTAVILDALAKLDPANELIPNVVRWLMVARRDGIWETTQETAWALIALTDWMVVTGELEGQYEYFATLNDSELASGTVHAENVDQSIKLRVAVAELLRDQGNRLDIGRYEGPGRLYYTAHLKIYLPVEDVEPANRGIIVYRQYTRADCEVGKECDEVDSARVGDVIQVKLTIVAPHDLYYVVVEDPLPAGAEAIDPSLATTSLLEQDPRLYRQAQNERWREFYRWWWHWYSRYEMRDEKMVLFADYLPAGTYEYIYTFRATLPGEYRVIPTFANEMYFPEVFGRSDGRLFTISE